MFPQIFQVIPKLDFTVVSIKQLDYGVTAKYLYGFPFPFNFSKFLCNSFITLFCGYFTDVIAHVR